MPIGDSKGAFYEDQFHHEAAPWMDMDSKDNNVIDPEVDPGSTTPLSNPVLHISDIKTASPRVTITDDDINTGIGLALAFSGGGLKTAGTEAAETVGKAALQYKGKTYEGANHGFALGDLMDAHKTEDFGALMGDVKQGFTTSKGRFVSREEAFDIAKKQDQIDPKVLPSLTDESTMLLSEDLK